MAYVALYRAYRPKTFEEVAGQKVIVKTLQNAMMHQKIQHAYLFSGPRGTGKTSIAKIFAKAVNCLNPQNGSPCNACEMCLGIEDNSIPDVIEIDAASNNGVDEIRELRDKVKYMPAKGKYKVYIVDEVHMLTPGAFNALLKTLEEPPKHIIFILATTEVHKIPPTILSRCQRFDFKNIETKDMVEKLNIIIEKEGISIDKDAVIAIAENAEGGLRDAISLLDQAISYADHTITEDDVHQVSGTVSKTALSEILLAINNKEVTKAIVTLRDLIAEGKEISRIVTDLILALRDILLEKTTQVEMQKYQELLSIFPIEKIYFYLDVLNELQQDMKWTHQKKAYVELAFIKMMEHQTAKQLDFEATIMDLKNSIHEIRQELKQAPAPLVVETKQEKPLVTIKDVEQILNQGDKEKKETLLQGWPYLANYPKEHLKLAAYLLSQASLEAVSDKMLLVYDQLDLCKQMYDPEIQQQVLEIINAKQPFITGYHAIRKDEWDVILATYQKLWNKNKTKPKLPPLDLKLYEDKEVERPISETVSLAQEYFQDKVRIKE